MTEDFYCDEVLSGRTGVRIVRETDNVLAYHHTRPFWPVHIVVIPKRHISSLLTLEESDNELLLEILAVVREVRRKFSPPTAPAASSPTSASTRTQNISTGTSVQAREVS